MNTRNRILVIDDDPLFRGLIVSLLRSDFIVMVAKEGAEGFYKAIEAVPDIVVVDVKMPGWDGIKTVKALRGHRATAECKVMMLTGDASRETVVSAIQAGADDYLIKTSFTNQELHEKLAALLGRAEVRVPANEPPAAGVSEADREGTLQEVLDGWE